MFKDYIASDLFDIKKGKRLTKTDMVDGNINFIGATSSNNGVTAKIGNAEYLHPAHTITVSYNGSVGEVFLQDEPFWASDDVNVWYPKFEVDDWALLYIMTLIKKLNAKYDYAAKWTIDKMRGEKLSLPVIESPDPSHEYTVDDIDWQYMRDYITELERDYITELERDYITELDAYLKATGLDDYELTDEDKKTLADAKTHVLGNFKVKDILPPIKVKKYAKKPLTEGNVPFVSCQSTNNGIAVYCDEKPEIRHCITVSTNGNCFDCFWHDYPIIPSSDVEVLSKDGITDNREISLYLCSTLAPNTKLHSYSNKPKNGKVFDTIIALPVIESTDPSHAYTVDDIDWDFMKRYIRAIEKQTIADVVRFRNRELAVTRQVVGVA